MMRRVGPAPDSWQAGPTSVCGSACYPRRMRTSLLVASAAALAATSLACSSSSFDVGAVDAGDAAVDSTLPDTTPDAPVKNACGGTTELVNAPGDACGACGKFVCDASKESIHCDDAGKNLCGGCGVIVQKLGDACGACGKYACKPDGSGVTCVDPGKNECGGCTKLPGKVGETCGGGSCGTGTLECAGKDTFACKGAVGTNACGGCGTLAGTPGTACGTCGVYSCAADKASVSCGEASPAPGTTCGTCKSSTYACTGLAVSTCTKPDDSSSGVDLLQEKTTGPLAPTVDHAHAVAIAYTVRHSGRIQSIKLTVTKGRYACPVGGGGGVSSGTDAGGPVSDIGVSTDAVLLDASLEDATPVCSSPDPSCSCKYDPGTGCVCGSTVEGALYAGLYKGSPFGGSTTLATASIAGSSVAAGTSVVTLTFPASIPVVAKGDTVWFQIFTTSSVDSFTLAALDPGPSDANPDLSLAARSVYPGTAFTKHPTSAVPWVSVQMLGCF